MKSQNYRSTILIAEDDPDDRVMIEQAFHENALEDNLFFVRDGIELIQYLHQEAEYNSIAAFPRPDLILLDLKMPRMDGITALTAIKKDESLRSIPVVMLTIIKNEQDVLRTYDLGGSGFIVKPNSFEELVEVVKAIHQYWFEVVELDGVEHAGKLKHKRATGVKTK